LARNSQADGRRSTGDRARRGLAGFRWLRGYVEDAAHALVLAVQRSAAAGRTYNVAYPVTYTEAEWVREIGRVVGWQGEIVALPASQLPESLRRDRFDYRQHFVIDSSRIRAELGYTEQVAFEEALRRRVAWERADPPDELKPDDYDYEAEDAVLSARALS
jgi:nucleoside-diphosphate-sugar epimerase